MKLTKVRKLVKEAGILMLYDNSRGETRWIGTDRAAYSTGKLNVSRENIRELLDFDQKTWDKLIVDEQKLADTEMIPESSEWKEEGIMMSASFSINSLMGEEIPIGSKSGDILLMRKEELDAAGTDENYTGIILTKERGFDSPLLLVFDGMIAKAIIKPEGKAETDRLMSRMFRISTEYGMKEQEADEKCSSE